MMKLKSELEISTVQLIHYNTFQVNKLLFILVKQFEPMCKSIIMVTYFISQNNGVMYIFLAER